MRNPITEVPNDLVWEFLLKDDCKSPWGTDMKYLFNLYQGENLGEEKSVLGEVDVDPAVTRLMGAGEQPETALTSLQTNTKEICLQCSMMKSARFPPKQLTDSLRQLPFARLQKS